MVVILASGDVRVVDEANVGDACRSRTGDQPTFAVHRDGHCGTGQRGNFTVALVLP